jgi:hypothetical protein
VIASDPLGESMSLVAGVAEPPPDGASLTLDITPLTTAQAAMLTEGANPELLTSPRRIRDAFGDAPKLTKARDTLRAALSHLLEEAGIAPRDFDPTTSLHLDNARGIDPLLDAVSLMRRCDGQLTLAGKALLVDSGLDPAAVLALDSTMASDLATVAPLPVPAARLDFLDDVPRRLNACFSLDIAKRADAPQCDGIVAKDFLDGGYRFEQRYPELFSEASLGAKFSLPETLYFDRGSDGYDRALVKIRWRFTDGRRGQILSFAQHLPQGVKGPDGQEIEWVLAGDRQSYDFGATSFIARRTVLHGEGSPDANADDSDPSRFETGLQLRFDPAHPNNRLTDAVNAVKVQGAGLPAEGVVLLRSREPGHTHGMTINNKAGAIPRRVAAGYSTSSATVSLFRWSWQTADGGHYAPAAENPAYAAATCRAIPSFAAYRFSLYDRDGYALGAPLVARNPMPPMSAAYAAIAPWHSLTPASREQVFALSASTTQPASVLIAWRPDPLAPPVGLAALMSGNDDTRADGAARVAPGANSVELSALTNAPNAGDGFVTLNTDEAWRQVQLQMADPSGLRRFDNSYFMRR